MNSKLYLVLAVFALFLISSVSAQNTCEGKLCGDNNPCTVDACDESTGACVNLPVPDKYSCGEGMECKDAACVESLAEFSGELTDETAAPTGLFGFLDYDLSLLLISSIIIVAAAYYALKK
ncbi:MAG: hypothetical protein ABID38_06920 [Candidatus Diapherotrites archaeon]